MGHINNSSTTLLSVMYEEKGWETKQTENAREK